MCCCQKDTQQGACEAAWRYCFLLIKDKLIPSDGHWGHRDGTSKQRGWIRQAHLEIQVTRREPWKTCDSRMSFPKNRSSPCFAFFYPCSHQKTPIKYSGPTFSWLPEWHIFRTHENRELMVPWVQRLGSTCKDHIDLSKSNAISAFALIVLSSAKPLLPDSP